MGMKIKYETFGDRTFLQGMMKMSNHPFKSVKFAQNITRIAKAWNEESKTNQELVNKTIKQYANLDEKGELKFTETGPDVSPEKRADLDKAMKDLSVLDFEIKDAHKIPVDQLEGVGLTALELMSLEPLLIELESVKTEEVKAS